MNRDRSLVSTLPSALLIRFACVNPLRRFHILVAMTGIADLSVSTLLGDSTVKFELFGEQSLDNSISQSEYTLTPLMLSGSLENGHAEVHAEPGYLRFAGETFGRNAAHCKSRGDAWVTDKVTISAPGLAGQTGWVHFAHRLEGNLNTSGGSPTTSARYQGHFWIRSSVGGDPDDFFFAQDDFLFTQYGSGVSSGTDILGTRRELVGRFNFGEAFDLEMSITPSAGMTPGTLGLSAAISIEHRLIGVVLVTDSEGNPIAEYEMTSLTGKDYRPKELWAAGPDLAANETGDGEAEKTAENSAWSYGHRPVSVGSALTFFTPLEHGNGIGHHAIDGWSSSDAGIYVNRGLAAAVMDVNGTLSEPILPGQLVMQPTTGRVAVARWTAPGDGTFNITARWIDVDGTDGGGATGAVGHMVVNGAESLGTGGIGWPNGGGAEMPPKSFRLSAGDTVDFVTGTGAENAGDLTAFNAVIRQAPDFELSAPSSIAEGDSLTVTVNAAPGTTLTGVALRVNGEPVSADVEAPFEFILPDLTSGLYHLQAEAVDKQEVLAASNVLLVTVTDGSAAFKALGPGTKEVGASSASGGSTYDCLVSGEWTEPTIWSRRGDNANVVPGAGDIVFISSSCQVTLTSDVAVWKLFSEGIVQGEAGQDHELTVTDHFSLGGVLRDLTVYIPETGLFTNIRFPSLLENTRLVSLGRMVVARGLFGENSEVVSNGSLKMMAAPGSGGPVILRVEDMTLGGTYTLGPGVGILAESLVAAGAGNLNTFVAPGLIGADGASLIGADGASLISYGASALIGADGASLIGADGATLIGADGASLIGADGASLIGLDGATVIGQNGASLIGLDGATLIGADGASLIGADGASMGRIATAFMHAASPSAGAASGSFASAGRALKSVGPAGFFLTGGSLYGSGNLLGTVTNQGAAIWPGSVASPGILRVLGDFRQEAGGALILEIAGTQTHPVEYDRLVVTGAAVLGGELIINTIDGYTLQTNDVFDLLRFRSRTGNFDRVTSDAELAFDENGITIAIGPPISGTPPVINAVAVNATLKASLIKSASKLKKKLKGAKKKGKDALAEKLKKKIKAIGGKIRAL